MADYSTDRNRGRRVSRPRFILAFIAIAMIGCSLPKSPGSLWWDIDVVVPLGIRTYGIWDLADSDSDLRDERSGIGLEEDSSAFFAMWSEATIAVRDCLSFAPVELTVTKPVTALFIPLEVSRSVIATLNNLNPEIAALHGTTQNIEPHPLDFAVPFELFSELDSMVIDTGSVGILIANRLPYPIENVLIAFQEPGAEPQPILNEFTLGSDQQIFLRGDLAGVMLSQSTSLVLSAVGTGGSQIAIDSTDLISVGITIDTVAAGTYHGQIPEQVLAGDSSVATGQQHHIQTATIKSGSLFLRLINQTQLDDTLTMIVPDIISRLGDSLVVKRFVPAGEEDTATVNLVDFQIRLPDDDPQQLRGTIIAHSAMTPEDREFISGTEYASGQVSISRLLFDFFEGDLNSMLLPIAAETISIERPPEGWDVLHPLSVSGRVFVEESFGGVADLDMNVQTLLFGELAAAADLLFTDVDLTTDTFAVVEDLGPLFSVYPDSAVVNGFITINGRIAIFDNSVIRLALQLKSPLTFTMDDLHPPGTIELIDTGDLQDIQSGSAEVRIWNRLPVGGRVFMVASRDSAALARESGAAVDTVIDLEIPSPPVEDGRAVGTAFAEISLTLNDTLLSFFQQPPFYARTDIFIPGSNGDTLIAHGTDNLKVQILARLVYEIRTGEIQ